MIASATIPSATTQQLSTMDEVCQNRIQHLLKNTRPEFRELEIASDRGTVTVKGQVASFYLRQIAIQCCQKAAGVHQINDQLQVGTA